MEIIHQQQPTDDTCTSTCLAMLLNINVKTIIEEFHEDYKYLKQFPDDFLRKCGVIAEPLLPYYETKWEEVYIVAVPSLNTTGQLHNIILDYRNERIRVYDPNKGIACKRYYVEDDHKIASIYEHHITGLVLEYKIHLKKPQQQDSHTFYFFL